jgi:hypothetical protein
MQDDAFRSKVAAEIAAVMELIDLRLLPELPTLRTRRPRKRKTPNTAIISEYAQEAMARRLGGDL